MNIFALMSQFNQFKKNPMGALSKTFNLPDNITNTDDALNYLMNSDKIPQDKKQQAKNMLDKWDESHKQFIKKSEWVKQMLAM